jgi:hypothetical protein
MNHWSDHRITGTKQSRMITYMEALSIEELIAEEIAEGVLPCKN